MGGGGRLEEERREETSLEECDLIGRGGVPTLVVSNFCPMEK